MIKYQNCFDNFFSKRILCSYFPQIPLKPRTFGHADIKMTMRYTHPTLENKRRAVGVLSSLFERENSKNEDGLDIICQEFPDFVSI